MPTKQRKRRQSSVTIFPCRMRKMRKKPIHHNKNTRYRVYRQYHIQFRLQLCITKRIPIIVDLVRLLSFFVVMWFKGLIILSITVPIVHSFVGIAGNEVKWNRDTTKQHMLRWKQMMAESAVTANTANMSSRRAWLSEATSSIFATAILGSGIVPNAYADDENDYNNPNIPEEPEEKSGLIVLRIAEVAQFQEKILRAVANGEIEAIVSPQQIVFGTQILLRNSNLDGNMKLMIAEEIPRKNREAAIQNAVRTMNTLQYISSSAARIMRPFKKEEMLEIADMYRDVRVNLNQLYEYLPPKEKAKYYGYFMAVTEYEKKIADGTYNPDLDGILKYD